MPSKLQQTYARYKQEAGRLQRELIEVRAKLAALEEAGAADMPEQATLPIPTGTTTEMEDKTLTKRAEDIVNSSGRRIRRIEVAQTLRAAGYVPAGAHFDVTLFKTLMRLKNQGKIGAEKVEGKWLFFPLK